MKSVAVILCGCLLYCAVQVSARVYETSDSVVVEGIHLFISSLSQSFGVPLLTCQRLLAAGLMLTEQLRLRERRNGQCFFLKM